MKEIKYEKKDGSEGVKYTLVAGDVVTCKYDTPRASKLGKYENYSLAITEPEQFVQLTATQFKKLNEEGGLTGKQIEAYAYENDFGSQVGVRVKG